jgi:NADH-quinone oxidoreductase subunit F
MPAQESEVDEAINEGINIKFLTAPVRVLSTNGRVEGIECVCMALGDVDESGRRRPVPIEGSEYKVNLDTLIPAIGQEPEVSSLGNGFDLELTKWNTIKVDQETLYTGKEGIFAGGDVVTGPQTVSEAMAQGKIAAESICQYLRGESLTKKYEVTQPLMQVEPTELTEEEIEKLTRPEMPSQLVPERTTNFNEVELGFTQEMAVNEAKRCLRCDLREE